MFLHFYDVTADFCRENGISALICDIDNTLVTYDDPEPTERVLLWLSSLEKVGVKAAFVSNNNSERVDKFNSRLCFPAYSKSGKPKTEYILKAISDLGVEKTEAVCLGDQLFTDCCGAKRAGVRMILVPPIKDKKTPFFKAKRSLELPFMKRYLKDAGIERSTWGI